MSYQNSFPQLRPSSCGLGTLLAITADTVLNHADTLPVESAHILQQATIGALDNLGSMAEKASGINTDTPNDDADWALITAGRAMIEISTLLDTLNVVLARDRNQRSKAAKGGIVIEIHALKGGV